ncbi:MAG: hypothetical protein WC450_08645 [Candidatus Omnitrophota bacterium]|jgi:hypothetical protein
METTVKFYHSVYAIKFAGSLKNLNVEQLNRLSRVDASVSADPRIKIDPALVVLLGLNPETKVTVASEGALNQYVSIVDDGTSTPACKINYNAIMAAWLASGAPLTWDGNTPSDAAVAENRKKFARDAAGRFLKI